MKPRALLSVSDKDGIAELGRALIDRGWELLSTGGTARALQEAGLEVTSVAEVTGHPEMMEGRVKTLHPAVHAGLLARRDHPEDLKALAEHGYQTIDLVAVNLYPFRETIAQDGITTSTAMGKVDIGGPTMIRAAAKSHRDVWVLVDPSDYSRVLGAMDGGGDDVGALRRELAAKVFRHISVYDQAVAEYLEAGDAEEAEAPAEDAGSSLPSALALDFELRDILRYGENPSQAAGFYVPAGGASGSAQDGIAQLEQKHGKALSYNNLLDLDGALLALAPFAYSPKPMLAIIKHTTPCGVGVGETLREAYGRALATDPMSSFGSVIAVNRVLDAETAEAMSELFIECIVAPAFEDDALEILTRKKNLRLLLAGRVDSPVASEPLDSEWWSNTDDRMRAVARFLAEHGRRPSARVMRSVYGGLLVQTPPAPPFYGDAGDASWTVATERSPTPQEWDDLRFAWAVAFSVKSNAIVMARDRATLGIGAGQMSRVDSSRIAVMKAKEAGLNLAGSALASDAFFPFRDGVDAAAAAGVKTIVQPGGSIRDEEVVQAANEHGMAMVFTGERLFRH